MSATKLQVKKPVPSDLTISQSITPEKIERIAESLGITGDELTTNGPWKAKVDVRVLERLKQEGNGNYVVVTGITPTPLGEGKSTTIAGLSQALGAHLQKKVIACVRQPCLAPLFSLKGGAAGGGYSQVIPMDEFNLNSSGDMNVITTATNLIAAQIDARIMHEAQQNDAALFRRLCPPDKEGKRVFAPPMIRRLRRLGIEKECPNDLINEEISRFVRLDIDPGSICWNRVVDMNDRFLRHVTIGLGPDEKGFERETQFDSAMVSELMSILSLCTSFADMRERLRNIVVAYSKHGTPITTDDLGISGALLVLLQQTINPTLMQTIEHTPVLIHACPFADVAPGSTSIIADQMALKLVGQNGYVVTESGFGSDIGLEKFIDVKCRNSNLTPNCIVFVVTVRALKMHGGGPTITSGLGLPDVYRVDDVELVKKGVTKLEVSIRNCLRFGVAVVVCVNRFESDSDEEVDVIRKAAKAAGAFDACICRHWAEGGAGCKNLANAVIAACESQKPNLRYLYPLDLPIKEKIDRIATEMYGADGVEYSQEAERRIRLFTKQGLDKLPICIAKTHLSLDTAEVGKPKPFTLSITDVRAAVGAGFLFPVVGTLNTIPGLPTRPCFYDIDVDENSGRVVGLF